MDDAPPLPDGLGAVGDVTVLWRPGCPFCAMLLGRLERSGLRFGRVDIWEQPDAAAWVRTVADGNETVPTVRIASPDGLRSVALVNPSLHDVLDHAARLTPASLPPGGRERRGPGLLARLGLRRTR